MTEVKELIERITQNPLEICDIDWVKETDDFNVERIREILYRLPHALYEPLKQVAIAHYYKSMHEGPGCAVAYRLNIPDPRFESINTLYGEGENYSIESLFYWIHEERLTMEREAMECEEKINSVRKLLSESCPTVLDDENNSLTVRKLKLENEKLKAENSRLEEKINEMKDFVERNSFDFKFGLEESVWTEICFALGCVTPYRKTESGINYSNVQIAKALSMLTGYSDNNLRYRKNEKQESKDAAKQFLADIAKRI